MTASITFPDYINEKTLPPGMDPALADEWALAVEIVQMQVFYPEPQDHALRVIYRDAAAGKTWWRSGELQAWLEIQYPDPDEEDA